MPYIYHILTEPMLWVPINFEPLVTYSIFVVYSNYW